MRSFLKWPGGKAKIIDKLKPHLKGKRLVEPFVGGGSVFLNLEFDSYLLCDINVNLINTYNQIKEHKTKFIKDLAPLFTNGNDEKVYYKRRNEFNITDDLYRKAILFVYLNRHGFNGLCRYNKSGVYNVPFGWHKKPYFPKEELLFFLTIVDKCEFKAQSYTDTFKELKDDDVVYCDPPYYPEKKGYFVSYSREGFTVENQVELRDLSEAANCKVVLTNTLIDETKELYRAAEILEHKVGRSISRKGDGRKPTPEIIIIYKK